MPIRLYDFLGKTSKYRPCYNKYKKMTINLDEGLLTIEGTNAQYHLTTQIDLQGTGGDLYITWTMSQQSFNELWAEAYKLYQDDHKQILDIKTLTNLMEAHKSKDHREFH